jgi:hypothetical protein
MNSASAMSCSSLPRIIFVRTKSIVAGRNNLKRLNRKRVMGTMCLAQSRPQKHFALWEQMGDVKALRFEAIVHRVPRIPKAHVICKGLDLVTWNNCIHILRRGSRCRWIVEAKPDCAAPINSELNLMIKNFVQREEQTFWMRRSRAHPASAWRGRTKSGLEATSTRRPAYAHNGVSRHEASLKPEPQQWPKVSQPTVSSTLGCVFAAHSFVPSNPLR